MARRQIALINQALNSAVSSINMARQLMHEIENEHREEVQSMPGVSGKFEGEYMLGQDGKRYPVSENYASKSQLVYGDTLKMVDEGGRPFFKQIDRVKRLSVSGILAKKDGKWHAVTADGSYALLSAAVTFNGGKEGDEVSVIIPADNKRVPFAAFEKLLTGGEAKGEVKKEEPRKEIRVEKKEPLAMKVEAKKPAVAEKPIKKEKEKEEKPAPKKAKPSEDELR